jgi:hypothetical protein
MTPWGEKWIMSFGYSVLMSGNGLHDDQGILAEDRV